MSDVVIGIEDLLGRFTEGGTLDSSGSFTLDPKKAMEKLAKFTLPSPYHWILKIVQSLHSSGAGVIDIKAGIGGVVVTSDAVPRGFSCMNDLLGHLLADEANCLPSLRHLAAGLQGCLGVSPREVSLTLSDANEVNSYVLMSGGWRESKVKGSGGEKFKLVLRRSVRERIGSSWFTLNSDVFDLIFKKPKGFDRENAVVYEACKFTGCKVLLAGKEISIREFGRPRFRGYQIRSDPEPGLRKIPMMQRLWGQEEQVDWVADRRHHLAEKLVPAKSGLGFKVSAADDATLSNRSALGTHPNGLSRAYAIRMELSEQSLLVFIDDGVIIDSQVVHLGCLGLVALIDVSNLRKDLSTLKIVEGEQLGEIKQEAYQAWLELRRDIEEHLEIMPLSSRLGKRLLSMGETG